MLRERQPAQEVSRERLYQLPNESPATHGIEEGETGQPAQDSGAGCLLPTLAFLIIPRLDWLQTAQLSHTPAMPTRLTARTVRSLKPRSRARYPQRLRSHLLCGESRVIWTARNGA